MKFSDKPFQVNSEFYNNLLFGENTGTLRDYFRKVSYGNLDIVTVNLPESIGWLTAPQTYAYYVNQKNGMGAYPQNSQKLVEDIAIMVNTRIDFSQYDNDKDGNVDALFIIHSGRGAEFTGSDNDMWSHAWSTVTKPILDGVIVDRYSIEPEYWSSPGDMTCGVFAHEMGHSAFGLPDLYDTDYSSYGIGKWSLMAYGSWNGPNSLGNSPAYPDAWSRAQMGYLTPVIVTNNILGKSISNAETSPEAYLLWNSSSGNESFLLENRQKLEYDAYLPGSGLCIYHIDNSVGSNNKEWYPGHTTSGHYCVAMEQGDGLWNLEHKNNYGDAGDPYPGSTNNINFGSSTVPDSRNYDLNETNIKVTNILSASNNSMIADLYVLRTTSEDITITYPQGGEVFIIASNPIITYTSTGTSGYVSLDYSTDGGINWNLISSNETANGKYTWKIPNTPSDKCKIRIKDVDGYPSVISKGLFIIGSQEFTELTPISLPGILFSSAAWGDYDNDNDLDILVSGNSGSSVISQIYNNKLNDLFEESVTLPGTNWGSLEWGDYNNDGYLDAVITGTYVSGKAFTKIFRNNGNNTFSDQSSINLVNVMFGSSSWGDYDNDGDLDLLITGLTEQSVAVSKIYQNNGNNTFSEKTSILIGITDSSVDWGDYDNDGDIDIVLCGNSIEGRITKVYENNGNSSFSEIYTANLIGVCSGTVAWGDYDNDSYLDILVTGAAIISGTSVPVSKIYHNDRFNKFTEQTTISLYGVNQGSSTWGDYDNDGDLDILINGYLGPVTKIYRNNGNNTFTEQSAIALLGTSAGSVAWGDYDNDNDLDLIITGGVIGVPKAKIYRNNCSNPNSIPTIPSNLSATIIKNDITFTWDKSIDKETPQNGLNYNLLIGTSPDNLNILSPMSDKTTGYRRVVRRGNSQTNKWTIRGLPDGDYYWSVQAIDNSFAASPFAPVQHLTVDNKIICNPDMICYWKLDELNSGNYKDVINDLDAAGTISPIPVKGIVNGAQQFNGSTTKINVPPNPLIDFSATGSFSVEFWYKGNKIPSTSKCAVGRYIGNPSAKWWVGLNGQDGRATFYLSSGGASAVVKGPSITDGNWHHVVAARNGSTRSIKIYVDGILRASTSKIFLNDFSSPRINLNIGWYNFQDAYALDGALDEIAIYNKELPAAVVEEHYNRSKLGLDYCGDPLSPPVITSTPPTSKLYYGQKFVYDVDATGYPAPTYSLHLYSYLMFIDPVTGLFEWTPLDPGEYQVTVKASNGVFPDALQTFTISVMDTLVCPPQLVSHWKLDEINSNTFSDEMGLNTAYGYNLTPVYEGRSNAGQWFNGSTSKINVPPDPSFDFPANGSFTVEFWYKGDKSPSTSKCAVGRYIGNPPARWWVGLNSLDGRAVFYISSGGSSAVVRGAPIVDGIWHHVAASRNGITKSMKIYVDGVLQDSTFKVFTNNFSSPGANLNVGWYNFQSAYALEGVLDEIAIFNDELPASEIEKHYKRVSYCTRGLLAPPEISASLQADVIPSEYMLYQNFPNPFNPETEIRFSIPEPGRVTIKIYNLLGEEAAELVNDFYETGTYTKHFDASGLSSGVYFYRMESGKYSSIRKLIILK